MYMSSWKNLFLILLIPVISFASEVPCQSPHKGKAFNHTNIQPLIKQQANLCGTDLKGINLSHQVLNQFNFAGADLSEATLTGIALKSANLYKTYFRNSHLQLAKFYAADLTEASFEYANIEGADFKQATLLNANLSFSQAQNASFRGADLTGANLSGINLQGADLSYANLTGANLAEANLTNATLAHAKLIRANLNQATLTNTQFLNADLTESRMTSTDMTNTNFTHANLNNAVFQPRFGTQPDLIALSHSLHFNTVHLEDFKEGAASLNTIRREYKRINMRQMERTLTAILKQEEMYNAWEAGGWGYVESTFSYIMFYLTSDFGAAPGRPLRLVIFIIFLLCNKRHHVFKVIFLFFLA